MVKGALNEVDYYKTFYKIQEKFHNVLEYEYENFLSKDDQVLRYIAMYLLENYKAEYHAACTLSSDCKERCKHLNNWLNEKQAVYTSNGKCTNNNKLWEQYIEGLWNELQRDSGDDKKCERDKLKKNFPVKWLISSCNNSNPVKIVTSCPEPPEPQEKDCPLSEAPTSSSCKAFSSVGMMLNNLIRGKKIKKRNMDNENNESFRSPDNSDIESLDRRFNVIYNSLQN
ncbi:PIR Superfamily Protein [Plasmodium ovale wallikeri]|uniref:PIR Superfamily Protein n=1 Tax=Plasmodium ovale wallikeri TaxID=864142 RepID=A0A1A9AHL4_PLAOA|nr:PIR Superfamily Protein [Plasmodium ovale wallikeri]